ncbi:MAG: UDP-N-acetylmuramoyl-L-alanine--D-glutamate ligase [Phycisphaerae bacterium]|nr:UDP-N-acetylmuramoyl-L-alanine--D-glutamate ligase [Phycisphaerae bacterium]
MHELSGKRVVVMGLGRFGGGVGVTRFCLEQGADVLVTDLLAEEDLRPSLEELKDLAPRFHLGGHDEADFGGADLVVVNPAVDRHNNRYLHAAERAGVPLTTEIELLIERLPNRRRTIGVTGSVGKSTTVAMIGHIMGQALQGPAIFVGGNIGGSLLERIDEIRNVDWVVLELSSFMLDVIGDWSPHIAVVTNIGENHLDRHPHLDHYVQAKKSILRHQTRDDRVVLGAAVADWRTNTPAVAIIEEEPIGIPLPIPGLHNQLNATYAIAACECAHIPREQSIAALATFTGLPHRLQLVYKQSGTRFYNDSKSTTPQAALQAMDSFEPGTCHFILGGSDKKVDLIPLARHAATRCLAVYTIGATGDTIADIVEAVAGHCNVHRCETLDRAVWTAVKCSRRGQHVVLSPGCASLDQFTNYEQRGRDFTRFVLQHIGEQ